VSRPSRAPDRRVRYAGHAGRGRHPGAARAGSKAGGSTWAPAPSRHPAQHHRPVARRSTVPLELKTTQPLLSDPAGGQALSSGGSLRGAGADLGRQGQTARTNIKRAAARALVQHAGGSMWEQRQILDCGGLEARLDGIRAKAGKRSTRVPDRSNEPRRRPSDVKRPRPRRASNRDQSVTRPGYF